MLVAKKLSISSQHFRSIPKLYSSFPCSNSDSCIFAQMYTHKKSLGQHFLKDETVIDKIIAVLLERPFENLLEVGPGAGALTKRLLSIPNIHFKAVELDEEKVDYLLKVYPQLKDSLIHESFLDIAMPFDTRFTVIGNFPYNISTQILFKIMDWKDAVPCVIGMFQVSNECFIPQPKVQSGVIRLTRRKEPLNVKSERAYHVLVKTAFNQRRKTLRNAVKPLFAADVLQDDIFNKRAEALSIEDFAALTFRMS